MALAVLGTAVAFGQGAPQQEAPMQSPVIREQYEWSNIWWDCANDTKLPRVLLIGDSISVGYSPVVTKLLKDKVHVDRLGTSRSINDPMLLKETAIVLEDTPYLVIHINNGLHGFHLTGPQYAEGLRKYLSMLRSLCPQAKVIWGTSTPITARDDTKTLDAKNEVVLTRNEIAAPVAAEFGLPTDDLYQVVVGKSELRAGDGYHYNAAGYDLLGAAVAESIRKALP
jgi:hypothetical protein